MTEASSTFNKLIEKYLNECQIGKISEEEFFEQKRIYAEPFQGFDYTVDENPDLEECMGESQETRLYCSEPIINRSTEFQNSLKSFDDFIYIIHGQAGAGKTTYAYSIKNSLKECPYLKFHFMDFSKYHSNLGLDDACICLEGYTNLTDGSSKFLWRISALVLEKILELLSKPEEETEENYLQRMQNTNRAYVSLFGNKTGERRDSPFFENMFSALSNSNISDLSNEVIKVIALKLNTLTPQNIDDAAAMLQTTLGVLLRLYTSMYFCDIQREGVGERKIFVFDNIERFVRFFNHNISIDSHEMSRFYNCLVNSIHEYKYFLLKIKDKYKCLNNPLCFLIVARNSTQALLKGRETHEDLIKHKCCVEITGWYNVNSICEKRFAYFERMIDESVKRKIAPYWRAFNNILKDRSISSWSLGHMLDEMYNYSVRRIIRMLAQAITDVDSDEHIKMFNEMWEVGKDVDCVRHICRQYIFALLLKQIRNEYTYLFDNAHFRLARKTILYLTNQRQVGAIDFLVVANAILVGVRNNKPDDAEVKEFIHVLYLMNERRWDENGWSALINVEDGKEHAYTEDNFTLKLQDVWEKKKANEFLINLNESGHLFAFFISSFEFFARQNVKEVVYGSNIEHKGLLPIFTVCVQNTSTSNCITVIENVNCRIVQVIKAANQEIKNFLNGNTPGLRDALYSGESKTLFCYDCNSDRPIVYSLRLIRRTLGYLQNYIGFLEVLIEKQPNRDKELRKIKSNTLLHIIDWLCDIVKIIDTDKEYFNDVNRYHFNYYRGKVFEYNSQLVELVEELKSVSSEAETDNLKKLLNKLTGKISAILQN